LTRWSCALFILLASLAIREHTGAFAKRTPLVAPLPDAIDNHLGFIGTDPVHGFVQRVESPHDQITQLLKHYRFPLTANLLVIFQNAIYDIRITQIHIASYGQMQQFFADGIEMTLPGCVFYLSHDESSSINLHTGTGVSLLPYSRKLNCVNSCGK